MAKTSITNTANTPKVACCSTRQKVYGIIALGGLFACGVMIGVAMNGGDARRVKEMGMSERQCNQIADKITQVAQGFGCSGDCVSTMRELNEIYTKNCAGRTFEVEAPKPAPKAEEDMKTCELVEDVLLGNLNSHPEYGSLATYSNNIEVYKRLIEKGCPENSDKYHAMIVRTSALIDALKSNTSSEDVRTCAEIEHLLMQNTNPCSTDFECHINNAKIYANISERGCPENKQKYVDLAAKELEIARALQDDKFSDSDREQISDTYRRIQMKQTANEILNKVQQLADPAIDFIIQAQKIIEE